MTATEPILDRVRDARRAEDDTAERILDAAFERFAAIGIRRTTMDDIAAAAGVGRATVYRRFAGRDDIIRWVILRELARFIDEVDASIRDIRNPVDRFVEGFVAMLRLAREHPLLRRLIDVEPDLLLPFLTVQGGPAMALSSEYLAANFRQSQQAGDIPAELDAELAAELVVRLCQSLLVSPEGRLRLDDDEGLRTLARHWFAPVLFRRT